MRHQFIDDPKEDQLGLVLEWAEGGAVMRSTSDDDTYLATFTFSNAGLF